VIFLNDFIIHDFVVYMKMRLNKKYDETHFLIVIIFIMRYKLH